MQKPHSSKFDETGSFLLAALTPAQAMVLD